ncbi:MAG TPA: hypothetical protein VKB78_01815, partial [Pirellulales bacterium]|nr:hypothetical protein [Pirellulales bacterium]
MLDTKQRKWVSRASKTLGLVEKEELSDAKQTYAETLKLLTPRFKLALPHDKDGVLNGKIKAACDFAKAGSYIDAQDSLDDAGHCATELISAQSEEHEPKKKGLIGKALPGKYKNEQYRKDSQGRVM